MLGAQPGERFLVFDTYELHGSVTDGLPVDPEDERLAELARQHPKGAGEWFAYAPEGSARDVPRVLGDD